MGTVMDDRAFRKWIVQEGNFAIFDYSAGEALYLAYKDLDRIIFPRIVAGHTVETRRRLGERVVQNIQAYLASLQ